ncbi:adenosylhomocysteinase [Legionella impletisoli]|nr:adenosylhomocysteinase [Legionella impletisoli]
MLLSQWRQERPLEGIKVLHHVPVVTNTLLKIACLIEAGADVTVTNPSFLEAHDEAVSALNDAGVRYVTNLRSLSGEPFDIYFDCGAELYKCLGAPTIGSIELTGSGDDYYRKQSLSFPVISIDRTLTKQLETVFGCAKGVSQALEQLTGFSQAQKNWLIFGFGKIGRGIAYFGKQSNSNVTIVDISLNQREAARQLGLNAVDPNNKSQLRTALLNADLVITATGVENLLSRFPSDWFEDKFLANMGVLDEFGPNFRPEEVLNKKLPINFVLKDPTPMLYIDPEFYLHNSASLSLLKDQLNPGVHSPNSEFDRNLITQWALFHQFNQEIIARWFIPFNISSAHEEHNTPIHPLMPV